jgi:hypothetical protein
MVMKTRRKSVPSRRSLDFQYQQCRRTKKRHRGGIKVWTGLFVFAFLAGALLFAYWKLQARVLDLRVGRAYEISRQVLKQTQRPQEEQERYAAAIARNAVEKGLNPAVVSAIVVVESGGNPLTISQSGDLGLMQVNARIHAHSFDFEEKNLLNPEQNIDVGTSILRTMADRHGDLKAIQAYNGLLLEKRDYAMRVRTVLEKAGFSPEHQPISSSPDLLAAISDWIAAVRASNGS